MDDLCTIETVGFVLRLVLQHLPSISFTSQFFQYLMAWINNGPLSSNDLHKLKLNLINSIGKVIGWTPCKDYVSIGAIMTAALQTLSVAESSLFNSISTITSHCNCPTKTKLFHLPIVYVEEKLTNSTLSLQAALNHIIDYNVQMPVNCNECGEVATEHRCLDLSQILVIELGRHSVSFTNTSLNIEHTLNIGKKTYNLLAVLMCSGGHTTCYFWNEGAMYFYDGMKNNGTAVPACELLNTSSRKKYYDHLVYIERDTRLEQKPTGINAKELFTSLTNQVEDSVMKPESLFKTLTANVIPSEKTKSTKRQKLMSNSAIDKITATSCCKASCVQLFSPQKLYDCRQMVAIMSESQKSTWLTKFFETNMNADDPSVVYLVNGVSVCQLAFSRVYGISVDKIIECKRKFMLGNRASMHGNCFRVYNSPKRDAVASWIRSYCDTYGDYVPTKDEIHLPSYMTIKEWYFQFAAEFNSLHPTEDPPTYETFKKVKRKLFANVKRPKETRLGKCSTCLLIKQQRFQGATEEKLKQLKDQMNEHIWYVTKDRQMYRQRADTAIKQPFLKMSVITDKSGAFQLPQHHPMPKEWTNVNLLQASFVGFINHGLNKKELVFFKETDYVADSDFYISLLFHHLKESLLSIKEENQPQTLYLQVDNSAAEGKNQYMLQFAALLVQYNWFEEVYIHYLQPGHTHEDIDRLFQPFHTFFKWKNIETMDQAIEFAKSIYPKEVYIHELNWPILAWKQWFLNYCPALSGHKNKYGFWLKNGLDGTPMLLYKQNSLDEQWAEVEEPIFTTIPVGQPQFIPPNPVPNELISTIKTKAAKFLSAKGLEYYESLSTVVNCNVANNLFSIGQQKREAPTPVSQPQKEILPITTRKRKLAAIEEHEWVVKSVVDHRKNGKRLEWLVIWECGEQSWEPRNCFIDADQSKNTEWSEYEKKRLKKQ